MIDFIIHVGNLEEIDKLFDKYNFPKQTLRKKQKI